MRVVENLEIGRRATPVNAHNKAKGAQGRLCAPLCAFWRDWFHSFPATSLPMWPHSATVGGRLFLINYLGFCFLD